MTVSAKLTKRYMHVGLFSFCGYFVRFSLRKDYRLHTKWILPHCPLSASSLCLCKPKCPSHRLSIDRSGCVCACSKKRHGDSQTQKTEWEATALTACVGVCPASCCLQSAGGACSRQQGGADGSTALTGGATTITQLNPPVVTF